MRRIAIGLGALAVLGVGAAVATGAIPDADGNFYACVKNSGEEKGSVRIIDKTENCKRKETRQHWPATQGAVPTTTTYTVVDFTGMSSGDVKGLSVKCNDGDVATGGGAENTSAGTIVSTSIPTPTLEGETPTGWFVVVTAGQSSQTQQLGVYAVCQHTE